MIIKDMGWKLKKKKIIIVYWILIFIFMLEIFFCKVFESFNDNWFLLYGCINNIIYKLKKLFKVN